MRTRHCLHAALLAATVVPALAQFPTPRAGRFQQHEIRVTAEPNLAGGCILVGTPGPVVIHPGAATSYRVEPAFTAVCTPAGFPASSETIRVELLPNFPAQPPTALNVAPAPTVTSVQLSAPLSTTMGARVTSNRTGTAGLVRMTAQHGTNQIVRSGCFNEGVNGQFSVPANASASGEIASTCASPTIPQPTLETIDGRRYYRARVLTWISVRSAVTVNLEIQSYYLWDADEPPPPSPFNLSVGTDIRVIQAIQAPGNIVPLIPFKKAVLRADVLSANGAARFTGSLNAYRDGVRHSLSPIAAIRPGTLAADSIPEVDNPGETGVLTFELPEAWTLPGKWEFEVEATATGVSESDTSDNRRRIEVEFEFPVNWPRRLTIGTLPVCRIEGAFEEAEYVCPDESVVARLGRHMNHILPLSDKSLAFVPITNEPIRLRRSYDRGLAGQNEFMRRMRRAYHKIQAASPWQVDQLLVVTPPRMFDAGFSDPAFWEPSASARVMVVPLFDNIDEEYLDMIVAHEFSHNHGLRHTATGRPCYVDPPAPGQAVLDDSLDPDTQWPQRGPEIAFLGWHQGKNAPVPRSYSDLMAYCPKTWVSPYTFEYLFRSNALRPELNNGRAPRLTTLQTAPRPAALARASASGRDVLLSGTIERDQDRATLDPAFQLPASDTPPASLEGANHCFVFLGPEAEVGRHCFPVRFTTTLDGAPLSRASFSLRVPLPEGATRVALLRDETELAALAPGAGVPEIRIVSPAAGDVWDGGPRAIRWEGADPDGDKLYYTTLYSADGQNWVPLDDELEGTVHSVDSERIPGGAAARVRVYASDGWNTAFAEVGPFEVRHAPVLEAPARLDLGATRTGVPLEAQLTLRAGGTGPVRISEIRGGEGAFSQPQAAPFVIPPRAAFSIPIRFSAAAAGESSASLIFVTATGSEHTVALTARALISGSPTIAASPAAVDFGRVDRGATGRSTLRVRNSGTLNLNVAGVTVSNAVFAFAGGTAFRVLPGAERELELTFTPTAEGAQTGVLRIASDDPARPSLEVALSGTTLAAAAPSLSAPSSLDFGTLVPRATAQLPVAVRNVGTAPLTIRDAILTGPQFGRLDPPAFPLTLAPGATRSFTIRYLAPVTPGVSTGTFTIVSDDPRTPRFEIAVRGVSAEPPAAPDVVLFSDSFARTATNPCLLGRADLPAGGSGNWYYLPVFGGGTPTGATVDGSALAQRGLDYGGVQFHRSATPCDSGSSENFGQDLRIKVDLLTPVTGTGVTQAGPFFRGRGAFRGDGILGGQNGGFWVQLFSTGQVKVKNLNTTLILAESAAITGYNAAVFHNLEVLVRGARLEVALDGVNVLNATLPPSGGINTGAAGIAFGAETNRGAAGGQKADNLVVSRPQ